MTRTLTITIAGLAILLTPTAADANYLHTREAKMMAKRTGELLQRKNHARSYDTGACQRHNAHWISCDIATIKRVSFSVVERCDWTVRVTKTTNGLRATSTWRECYEA